MLPSIYRAGVHTGIDPTVLAAQSYHETGGGKFGRAATPAHKNVAGVKITRPVGPDTNPHDHATFETWDIGAIAHAHHILAYASADLPKGDKDLSPRSVWVRPKNHGFTRMRQLGGHYAPSPQYGERLEDVATRLLQGA